jgi:hypothetical protein
LQINTKGLAPITTKVVSSKPANGEVYSIQHYVIKFVSDLRQVGGVFFAGTSVPSSSKIDRHDITEILLKMALTLLQNSKTYIVEKLSDIK